MTTLENMLNYTHSYHVQLKISSNDYKEKICNIFLSAAVGAQTSFSTKPDIEAIRFEDGILKATFSSSVAQSNMVEKLQDGLGKLDPKIIEQAALKIYTANTKQRKPAAD